MPPDSERWFKRVELLVLILGIGLRLARFIEQRPLWLDEVLLSFNILLRSPVNLEPLEWNQMSPLGFLWGEWLVTRIAGSGEHALRFLPFLGSIVALIAFARLARRVLEPVPALVATLLAATSPLLLYYSAEVKSYGLDWLSAILVMHATLDIIDHASRKAWARWSIALAFCALVSTAAPFVIGAGVFALAVTPDIRKNPREVLRVAAFAAPAILFFGLQYLTIYHSPSLTAFMQRYWTASFLDAGFAAIPQALNFTREFLNALLFDSRIIGSLPQRTTTILVVASGAGLFAVGRRSLATAALLVAPVLLAAAASIAHAWPLTPRLLLFAAPATLMTVPAGISFFTQLAPRSARTSILILVALVVVSPAMWSVFLGLPAYERFKPVPDALREVRQHAGPNSTVYVSIDIDAACTYYLRFHPDRDTLGGDPAADDCALSGQRTVIGEWPRFVGVAPGVARGAATTIDPEWLELEAARILEQPADEAWLLIGDLSLQDQLPPRLEAAGATRLTDRVLKRLRILSYRLPVRGSSVKP